MIESKLLHFADFQEGRKVQQLVVPLFIGSAGLHKVQCSGCVAPSSRHHVAVAIKVL
jgi:hypothetical protein